MAWYGIVDEMLRHGAEKYGVRRRQNQFEVMTNK